VKRDLHFNKHYFIGQKDRSREAKALLKLLSAFLVLCVVKCGAVIACTICRAVQTEDIFLDEFEL
jgi:hypothetical protein